MRFTPRKIRNTHPIVDCQWLPGTEGTGPPRFMNMPYMAKPQAR